jgi:hypothetical protein
VYTGTTWAIAEYHLVTHFPSLLETHDTAGILVYLIATTTMVITIVITTTTTTTIIIIIINDNLLAAAMLCNTFVRCRRRPLDDTVCHVCR